MIAKQIRNIHRICSKEPTRYATTTVQREKSDGRTVFSCTDGRMLVQVDTESNGEPNGRSYIEREEWALAYKGKHEPRTLDPTEVHFPTVADVIPDVGGETFAIGLNAKLLKELVTVLADMGENGVLRFSFTKPDRPVRIDVVNPLEGYKAFEGCKALGVLMPVNLKA